MADVTVVDISGKVTFNAGAPRPGAYAARSNYLARAKASGFNVSDNKVCADRSEIWDALDQ